MSKLCIWNNVKYTKKISSEKKYLLLDFATIRRVCKDNSSMVGTFFLWFQGRSKPSTNTNILTPFYAINPSRNFHLKNQMGFIFDAKAIEILFFKK